MSLIQQGIAPPTIKKAVSDVSLRWIYELRNRYLSLVKHDR